MTSMMLTRKPSPATLWPSCLSITCRVRPCMSVCLCVYSLASCLSITCRVRPCLLVCLSTLWPHAYPLPAGKAICVCVSVYSLALMLIHYLQGKAICVCVSVCLLSGLMLIHYLQGKAICVCVSVCLLSGPHAYLCHKYHFCHDKTHLLLHFVTFCNDKIYFLQQTCVCHDKSFVMTSILFFCAKNDVLLW